MSTIRTLVALVAFFLLGAAYAGEPVNINTADAEAIAEVIKGVGLKRAQAIIAYRDEHGPFKTVDGLVQVRGIGEKIVEDSRRKLTVGESGG